MQQCAACCPTNRAFRPDLPRRRSRTSHTGFDRPGTACKRRIGFRLKDYSARDISGWIGLDSKSVSVGRLRRRSAESPGPAAAVSTTITGRHCGRISSLPQAFMIPRSCHPPHNLAALPACAGLGCDPHRSQSAWLAENACDRRIGQKAAPPIAAPQMARFHCLSLA